MALVHLRSLLGVRHILGVQCAFMFMGVQQGCETSIYSPCPTPSIALVF